MKTTNREVKKMNTYTFNTTNQTDTFAPFTTNEVEYRLATIIMGNSTYANDQYDMTDANRFVNPQRVASILHMLGNGKKPQSTQ